MCRSLWIKLVLLQVTDNTLVQLSIHCPRLQALVNLHLQLRYCSTVQSQPLFNHRVVLYVPDSPCPTASWSQTMASELWAAVHVAKSASLWWSWITAPSSLIWPWSILRAAIVWSASNSTTVSRSPGLASNGSGSVDTMGLHKLF